MRIAYHETWLRNLQLVKEAGQWKSSQLISKIQMDAIAVAYPSELFHPNFIIRILLFLATLIALSGITGLFGLMFADAGQMVLSILATLYGIASYFFLERIFIRNSKHFKSGVNEALMYHASAFTVGGLAGATDFDEHFILWSSLIVLTFNGLRYLDLLSTAGALFVGSYLLFDMFYSMGGIFQQIIPFIFIIVFTPVYFFLKRVKGREAWELHEYCLLVAESFCLLVIYAAGNYFVVRELSTALMGLTIQADEDIPFAWLFYFLTILIPVLYLWVGIRKKDIILIRISLLVFAFSVFTFKYYYSLGHHEITLTIAGMSLLLISISLLRYLKIPRNGFTRENVLTEKWGNSNVAAILVSQTLGGNKAPMDDPTFKGGGGTYGGAGAGGEF